MKKFIAGKNKNLLDLNFQTRNAAFRKAKEVNGIPRSKQPDKVEYTHLNRQGKREAGREYTFGKKKIRDDIKGHDYPDDPSQNRGSHFNDEHGNHFNYPNRFKK